MEWGAEGLALCAVHTDARRRGGVGTVSRITIKATYYYLQKAAVRKETDTSYHMLHVVMDKMGGVVNRGTDGADVDADRGAYF